MLLSNLVQSPDDPRDYPFVPVVSPVPAKVDLRQWVPDIEDQALEGSCTCNSTTSALEWLTNHAGKWEDLSRQFPYYTVRDSENGLTREGAVLRDVLKLGSSVGFCLESEWPYLSANENVKPSDAAYASAKTRMITRYESVGLATLTNPIGYWDAINNIKSALAEGLPVVIALSVNETIFGITGPLKDQKYASRDPATLQPYPIVGNHAVVLLGYDDNGSYFIYQNSWGAQWGDAGFGAISYYEIGGAIFEAWVVRGFNGIEIAKPVAPIPDPLPSHDPVPTPAPTPDPIPDPPPVPPDPVPVPPTPDPVPAPPVPGPTPPGPAASSNSSIALIIGALLAAAFIAYRFGGFSF